jgi:hypothetical protein
MKFGIAGNGGTPTDMDVNRPDDILVSAGSGYTLHWNGQGWTRRKLGSGTHYAVSRDQRRKLIVGGGGSVYKRGIRSWENQRSSGYSLYGVLDFDSGDTTALACGSSGEIIEQAPVNSIY